MARHSRFQYYSVASSISCTHSVFIAESPGTLSRNAFVRLAQSAGRRFVRRSEKTNGRQQRGPPHIMEHGPKRPSSVINLNSRRDEYALLCAERDRPDKLFAPFSFFPSLSLSIV